MNAKLSTTSFSVENKASINSLIEWFLHKEQMSHKKIQKLCYYAQAWSQTLNDADIVDGIEFEAWVHGPVNTGIWNACKKFGWRDIMIDSEYVEKSKEECQDAFDENQIRVLELVWDTYGEYSADDLEALTHSEKPWIEAREGKAQFQNCSTKISRETMKSFYIDLYEA